MAWNPEYAQKYEDEMREKARAARSDAAREDAQHHESKQAGELTSLRARVAELERCHQAALDLVEDLRRAGPAADLALRCEGLAGELHKVEEDLAASEARERRLREACEVMRDALHRIGSHAYQSEGFLRTARDAMVVGDAALADAPGGYPPPRA